MAAYSSSPDANTAHSPEGVHSVGRIVAHPFFSTIVVLWFAALFSLSTLAIRGALLEEAVLASHVDLILPAATPPLGMTARLLIAALLGTIGAGLGWVVSKYIRASLPSAHGWAEEPASHTASAAQAEWPQRARAVPSARRPISAHEELGAERLDAPLHVFGGEAPAAAYASAQPAYATLAYPDYSATSAYPGYHAPVTVMEPQPVRNVIDGFATAPYPSAPYMPEATPYIAPESVAPQPFVPTPFAPPPHMPEAGAPVRQGWMPQAGFDTARLTEPAPYNAPPFGQNSWDPRAVFSPVAPTIAVSAGAAIPPPTSAHVPATATVDAPAPETSRTSEIQTVGDAVPSEPASPAVAMDSVTGDTCLPQDIAPDGAASPVAPQDDTAVETHAAPASGRERIATSALPQLGSVELIERLAIALERRNARNAGQAAGSPQAAPQTAAWAHPVAVSAPDAQPSEPARPAPAAAHGDPGQALDLALRGLRDIG